MNNNEKFEQIYSDILTNKKNLEHSRLNAKIEVILKWITAFSVIFIGLFIYLFLYNKFQIGACIFLFIYISVLTIIYFIAIRKMEKEKKKSKMEIYIDDFKQKVITLIIQSFDKNFIYSPHDEIFPESYDKAEFEKYDKYHSEDLISGYIQGCRFKMAEILTQYKTTYNGNPSYHTLFSGIFFMIKSSKPFTPCFYLRSDIRNKNILTLPFDINLKFGKLKVKVDSQEFEKNFDVYCTDKIIAMQLLTADIIQFFIDFQKENNIDFEITIKNDYIFIRFMSGKIFEPANLFKSSLDKKTIFKYNNILDFTLTLVNKIIELIQNTEYGQLEE